MRFSDFGSINKVLFVISAICLLISADFNDITCNLFIT